jgi:hypothetical protein
MTTRQKKKKGFNDAMKVESRKSIIEREKERKSEVKMRLQKSSEIRRGLSREIVVH